MNQSQSEWNQLFWVRKVFHILALALSLTLAALTRIAPLILANQIFQVDCTWIILVKIRAEMWISHQNHTGMLIYGYSTALETVCVWIEICLEKAVHNIEPSKLIKIVLQMIWSYVLTCWHQNSPQRTETIWFFEGSHSLQSQFHVATNSIETIY